MKNKELREIPIKNYVILGVVIVVTVLVLYYFYMWVDAYKESRMNVPILDKYMTVINYNELDNYLVENPNSIVYVSILEDEEIRNFEKKLKNKYKNNDVVVELLYMDITDYLGSKSVRNDMVNHYSLNNLNITDVPCILVFKNGILNNIYSIKDNGYDVNKMVNYINNIQLEDEGL